MAFRRLRCPKELVRVGIDRFTTNGIIDREISRLAFDWFTRTMTSARTGDPQPVAPQTRRLV
jgi:hypothetical protein